jgi:hypothetical protein
MPAIAVEKEMEYGCEMLVDGCTIHGWMDYPAIAKKLDTGYSPKDT